MLTTIRRWPSGWRAITALALIVAFVVAGCAFPGGRVSIKDDAGREVALARNPRRIVSLAPSNTEILFALGLDERVVAVTDNCNHPAAAAGKEKIGGAYAANATNFERIVALKPDLVVAYAGATTVLPELERLKLPYIVLNPKTMDDVLDDIVLVGRATGRAKEAEALVARLRGRLDAVAVKVRSIPEKDRPRVFYEVWGDPLMTAGLGTFIDEVIRAAGGINVAGTPATPGWTTYSLEALVQGDPTVVLTPFEATVRALLAGERKGWGGIAAVKAKRVVGVDQDIFSRPGPRLVDAVETLAKLLYPDLFR